MSTTTALPARLRAAVAAPIAEIDGADLRLLARFFGLFLVLALAMGTQLWARMEVRSTAVSLDATRAAVRTAQVERERLLLERTTLRSPGRLQAAADQLGLTAPVAVLDTPASPIAP